MNYKKTMLFAAATILFFGGCSEKQEVITRIKDTNVEEVLKYNDTKDQSLLSKLNLQNKKGYKREFIDYSENLNISKALRQLSEIEGVLYLLDRESTDIVIPSLPMSNLYKINNIAAFTKDIELRTDYTISIKDNSENRFVLNAPKVIVVEHKDKKLFENLKLGEVMWKNGTDVTEFFDGIVRDAGFNPLYNNKDGAARLSKNDFNNIVSEYMSAENINIDTTNMNAIDFFNYLSKALNLYIDIDYKDKIVHVNKYKRKIFNIAMNNLVIEGSLGTKSVSNENTKDSDIASKVKIKVFSELEESIKQIIEKNTEHDSKNSSFDIDDVNGQVTVKATKLTMDEVIKKIDKFNKTYNKAVDLYITIYDVLIERKLGGGIDISLVKQAVDGASSAFTLATQLHTEKKLQFTKDFGGGKSADFVADVLNEFGEVANNKTYVYRLTNHIPFYRTNGIKTTYTAKLDYVQTGTDDKGVPIYDKERDIETIVDGFIVKAKPMIHKDQVSLNLNIDFNVLLKMNDVTVGGDVYQEPVTSEDKYSGELKFRNGQTVLIDSLNVLGKAENYQGIVPLKGFVFGGKENNSYVNREVVFTATAVVVDNDEFNLEQKEMDR